MLSLIGIALRRTFTNDQRSLDLPLTGGGSLSGSGNTSTANRAGARAKKARPVVGPDGLPATHAARTAWVGYLSSASRPAEAGTAGLTRLIEPLSTHAR